MLLGSTNFTEAIFKIPQISKHFSAMLNGPLFYEPHVLAVEIPQCCILCIHFFARSKFCVINTIAPPLHTTIIQMMHNVAVCLLNTLNSSKLTSNTQLLHNHLCKVCSINFEPPDIDLCSTCHVYMISRGASIISILFIVNRFTCGSSKII